MNTSSNVQSRQSPGEIAPEATERKATATHRPRTPSAFTSTKHGAVVLIVDDVEHNLKILDAILTANHYEVLPATSGETALAHIAARRPDLILLDLMMPVMDGIEVCRRLKANPATSDIPVVFLTSANDADLATMALGVGAADYIFKPFNTAELLARVNAHVELKRTRDELERIITMKNQLMSAVAHDLQNPIGAARFSAQMLHNEGVRSPDPRGELVEAIIESCESALAFIDERLAESARASRIEHLSLTQVDLVEVVLADVHQNTPAAVRKSIDLILEFPETTRELVRADHRAVSRVMNNLLSNAIKFSPAGLPVHISVERHATTGRMHVSVRDHGPGITEEDRKHLFTAYRRLSARPTAGESSTGLGLSIAYDLMARMKGEIGCDSIAGQGATFWIALPLD